MGVCRRSRRHTDLAGRLDRLSIYSSTFGNYAKTYGVFAGIVVLLFWLWITAYAILLGAEINAESEQQTDRRYDEGREQPLGSVGAIKADSVPNEDPEAPSRNAEQVNGR
jgi:membrane protein